MTENAALIVVAAGTGERLGHSVHKALVPVAGRPMVEHGLRRLLARDELDPVVLVGHPDDRQPLGALVGGLPRTVVLADGGARRQDSVAAGVAAVLAADPRAAEGVVLVHDAARPLVPADRVPDLIEAAARHGAAVLAVPVADTIKEARADDPFRVERTVPRDRLWAVQTPQAFRVSELSRLLAEADRNGRTVTDEAGLFETAGLDVAFVEGSPLNFKITTREDLHLAQAILAGESGGTPS
jgi:2-C-methyl-D-erythritol 4-phosphate cytidylyltransferase